MGKSSKGLTLQNKDTALRHFLLFITSKTKIMAYQEKKTTGYGTRVGNSLKGILTGFVLIIGATILLWWNEGRAVKTDKMLNDAQEACIDMPNPDKKSAEFEGELVCASAMATTEEVLTDKDFGISENVIGLSR